MNTSIIADIELFLVTVSVFTIFCAVILFGKLSEKCVVQVNRPSERISDNNKTKYQYQVG